MLEETREKAYALALVQAEEAAIKAGTPPFHRLCMALPRDDAFRLIDKLKEEGLVRDAKAVYAFPVWTPSKTVKRSGRTVSNVIKGDYYDVYVLR